MYHTVDDLHAMIIKHQEDDSAKWKIVNGLEKGLFFVNAAAVVIIRWGSKWQQCVNKLFPFPAVGIPGMMFMYKLYKLIVSQHGN